MKKILILGVILIAFISCKDAKNNEKTAADTNELKASEMAYASFGEKIDAKNVLTVKQINEKYDGLKVGDTLNVKFVSKINSVCSKKGCWMRLDAGEEKEVMVKFKDYGFFMPLDAKGEVIVDGKAFVQETSVDELKHYAEDAGKSVEEIAKITEPKKTLSFVADGVLLKK
jgi:ribosomal protein S6E (S10)